MFSPAVHNAVHQTADALRADRVRAVEIADELIAELRDLEVGGDRAYMRATLNPLAGADPEMVALVAYNLAGRIARHTS